MGSRADKTHCKRASSALAGLPIIGFPREQVRCTSRLRSKPEYQLFLWILPCRYLGQCEFTGRNANQGNLDPVYLLAVGRDGRGGRPDLALAKTGRILISDRCRQTNQSRYCVAIG